jgi:hypothetical protein
LSYPYVAWFLNRGKTHARRFIHGEQISQVITQYMALSVQYHSLYFPKYRHRILVGAVRDVSIYC